MRIADLCRQGTTTLRYSLMEPTQKQPTAVSPRLATDSLASSKIVMEGITFDDVLLIPQHSNVMPADAITATRLTKSIRINTPLISAPMEIVFNTLTDLKFRAQWIPYLKDSDQLNSKIIQHGSSHRCLITGDASDPFLISHSFQIEKHKISFVESENRMKLNVFYTIRRIGNELTYLERVDCFEQGILNRLIYRIKRKRRYTAWVSALMDNLKDYCESLILEGNTHPSEIVLPTD